MDVNCKDLDLVEEFKLRTWARRNYVSIDKRNAEWHPVILHEMSQRDVEQPSHTSDVAINAKPSPAAAPKLLRRFRLNSVLAQIRSS